MITIVPQFIAPLVGAFVIALVPAPPAAAKQSQKPHPCVTVAHKRAAHCTKHRHKRHKRRCHPCDVAWGRIHHWHPAPTQEASGWAIPPEIVRCESTYTNEGPNSAGAAGYYQITEWSSKSAGLPVGHSGYASDHSKAEQDIVARHLYAEQGTGPWVSSEGCWGGKV